MRTIRFVPCLLLALGCTASSCGEPTTEVSAPTIVEEPTPASGEEESMRTTDPAPAALVAPPTQEQAAGLAAASNAFGFDLYQKVRTEPGDLVYSPASIVLAAGMVLGGARGPTADEMRRVMHADLAGADFHEAAGRQIAVWNDRSRTQYELRIANRLFGERTFTLENDFLALTRDRYGAPLEGLDFIGAAEAQRTHINRWVAEQTNEKILDLLPPAAVSETTRLVLVNAVYFLGSWESPFERDRTVDEPFRVAGGSSVNVPTMVRTGFMRFTDQSDARVVELPYRGGELAMVFVVPRAANGLGGLESGLDRAKLDRWVGGLRDANIQLHLPRFEIGDAQLDLGGTLPEMGMRLVFTQGSADLTGIARPARPEDALSLSAAIHEAFIRVDEEGTEAAAATAMMAVAGGPPQQPPVVRFDQPFLFFLRDVRSGAILFMGRVTDPR